MVCNMFATLFVFLMAVKGCLCFTNLRIYCLGENFTLLCPSSQQLSGAVWFYTNETKVKQRLMTLTDGGDINPDASQRHRISITRNDTTKELGITISNAIKSDSGIYACLQSLNYFDVRVLIKDCVTTEGAITDDRDKDITTQNTYISSNFVHYGMLVLATILLLAVSVCTNIVIHIHCRKKTTAQIQRSNDLQAEIEMQEFQNENQSINYDEIGQPTESTNRNEENLVDVQSSNMNLQLHKEDSNASSSDIHPSVDNIDGYLNPYLGLEQNLEDVCQYETPTRNTENASYQNITIAQPIAYENVKF